MKKVVLFIYILLALNGCIFTKPPIDNKINGNIVKVDVEKYENNFRIIFYVNNPELVNISNYNNILYISAESVPGKVLTDMEDKLADSPCKYNDVLYGKVTTVSLFCLPSVKVYYERGLGVFDIVITK